MNDHRLFQRATLTYLAIAGLFVGVWGTLFPRSFFDDFPGLGRAWVSVDGPFNEHLVRDVGQLSLAMAVVTIIAAATMQRALIVAASAGWLVNALPHLTYHARHLDDYETLDQVGNIVSLGLLVMLPAGVLLAAIRRPAR